MNLASPVPHGSVEKAVIEGPCAGIWIDCNEGYAGALKEVVWCGGVMVAGFLVHETATRITGIAKYFPNMVSF